MALTEKVGKKGKGGGEAYIVFPWARGVIDIPLELRASRECVSGSFVDSILLTLLKQADITHAANFHKPFLF